MGEGGREGERERRERGGRDERKGRREKEREGGVLATVIDCAMKRKPSEKSYINTQCPHCPVSDRAVRKVLQQHSVSPLPCVRQSRQKSPTSTLSVPTALCQTEPSEKSYSNTHCSHCPVSDRAVRKVLQQHSVSPLPCVRQSRQKSPPATLTVPTTLCQTEPSEKSSSNTQCPHCPVSDRAVRKVLQQHSVSPLPCVRQSRQKSPPATLSVPTALCQCLCRKIRVSRTVPFPRDSVCVSGQFSARPVGCTNRDCASKCRHHHRRSRRHYHQYQHPRDMHRSNRLNNYGAGNGPDSGQNTCVYSLCSLDDRAGLAIVPKEVGGGGGGGEGEGRRDGRGLGGGVSGRQRKRGREGEIRGKGGGGRKRERERF